MSRLKSVPASVLCVCVAAGLLSGYSHPGDSSRAAAIADSGGVHANTSDDAPDQTQLDRAVLSLGDLPKGWAPLEGPGDSDPCDLDISEQFGIDEFPYAQAAFAKGDRLIQQYLEYVGEDLAKPVLSAYESGLKTCNEDGAISVRPMPFPHLGDDSFAVRIVLPVPDGSELRLDVAIIRSGGVVNTVIAADPGCHSTALLRKYARRAVAKATRVLGDGG